MSAGKGGARHFIWIYDETGNRRIEVEVRRMDQVEYKRRGAAGSVLGLVDYVGGDRMTLQYLEGGRGRFSVPLSTRNCLALWRDGQRVTK